MGLITGLLTLPIAPVRGVAWVAQQLYDEAARELYDEDRIMSELTDLEMRHDAGEIDDEQLSTGIDLLLERLEEGRRYREWRAANG
jgi:Gas vesicle protein G